MREVPWILLLSNDLEFEEFTICSSRKLLKSKLLNYRLC